MSPDPAPPAAPRAAREPLVAAAGIPLLLAALAVLPFLPALDGGFLDFDDRPNLLLHDGWRGLGAAEWRHAFGTFHGGHFQPLAWLSFGFDFVRAGMDPRAFHATNLALHGAAAAALYLALVALLRAAGAAGAAPGWPLRAGAAAGALLFAVHPMRVESVAWITERRDLVSAVPLFLSLALWLRAHEPGREARSAARLRLAALAAFAVSLLGKAAGMTFPAVLLLLDAWPLRRLGPGGPGPAALVREKAGFLLLAAAAAAAAPFAQAAAGALRPVEDLGLVERLAVAAYGLAYYARATAWPAGLAALHELPRPVDPAAPAFLASAFAVAAAASFLARDARHRPGIAVAAACYAVVLAPVLGLFQSGPQLVADRYAYLGAVPLAALAAEGVRRALAAGGAARALAAAGTLAALVALAVAAHGLAATWTDDVALWRRGTAVHPGGRIARYNLGTALLRAGDLEGAEAELRRAAALDPAWALPRVNLASLLHRAGREAEAEAEAAEAHRLDPSHPAAREAHGQALLRAGRAAEAEAIFAPGLGGEGEDPEARAGHALARLLRGDDGRRVLADLEAAPTRGAPAVLAVRATLLHGEGRTAEAAALLARAVADEPRDPGTRLALGTMLAGLGDAAGAREHLGEAVRLAPGLADARYNLGALLAAGGDLEAALPHLEEAARLAPGDEAVVRARDAVRAARERR